MPSRIKILDIGYGVLNPAFNSYAKNNYDTEEAGFMDLVKRNIDDQMGFSEFEGQGPMIGICLRVEGQTNTNGAVGPTDWFALSRAAADQAQVDTPSLWQIKVRIPELHAYIPIPSDLPTRLQSSPDHNIINLYPTFTAQTTTVSSPQNRELLCG